MASVDKPGFDLLTHDMLVYQNYKSNIMIDIPVLMAQ